MRDDVMVILSVCLDGFCVLKLHMDLIVFEKEA